MGVGGFWGLGCKCFGLSGWWFSGFQGFWLRVKGSSQLARVRPGTGRIRWLLVDPSTN